LSEVSTWFDELFLPAPNRSRLRDKLKQSGRFVMNGGTAKLHARSIDALDQKFPSLSASQVVPKPKSGSDMYVDMIRLGELRALPSTTFDLTKLIRLCEELNTCFAGACFFSTAMLVRSIIDHVPPVFGFKSFAELANCYGGGRSVKESLQRLELSSRKIADQHLHTQIRQKESTPTKTQVDFSNDLDVLLAEIVRTLK
jgi:hypothetical protein